MFSDFGEKDEIRWVAKLKGKSLNTIQVRKKMNKQFMRVLDRKYPNL